jgi:uncharacterized protein with HEPN domain
MREPRYVQDYIQDILDSMAKAENFIDGLELLTFTQDDRIGFAVVRCLEIIGEAARKIPLP